MDFNSAFNVTDLGAAGPTSSVSGLGAMLKRFGSAKLDPNNIQAMQLGLGLMNNSKEQELQRQQMLLNSLGSLNQGFHNFGTQLPQ